jgi:hypothetical protein
MLFLSRVAIQLDCIIIFLKYILLQKILLWLLQSHFKITFSKFLQNSQLFKPNFHALTILFYFRKLKII